MARRAIPARSHRNRDREHNGRFLVSLGERSGFDRPRGHRHPTDRRPAAHAAREAGYTPQRPGRSLSCGRSATSPTPLICGAGRQSQRSTSTRPGYTPSMRGAFTPEQVKAEDPRGLFHNVYHRAGNPDGTYEDDSPEYWRTLAHALSPASEILILGHGKGKANATLTTWSRSWRSTSATWPRRSSRMSGSTSTTTDNQLLRLGQLYFNESPCGELRREQ